MSEKTKMFKNKIKMENDLYDFKKIVLFLFCQKSQN